MMFLYGFSNACEFLGGQGYCSHKSNLGPGYRFALERKKCSYHNGWEKKCIGYVEKKESDDGRTS